MCTARLRIADVQHCCTVGHALEHLYVRLFAPYTATTHNKQTAQFALKAFCLLAACMHARWVLGLLSGVCEWKITPSQCIRVGRQQQTALVNYTRNMFAERAHMMKCFFEHIHNIYAPLFERYELWISCSSTRTDAALLHYTPPPSK